MIRFLRARSGQRNGALHLYESAVLPPANLSPVVVKRSAILPYPVEIGQGGIPRIFKYTYKRRKSALKIQLTI